MCTVQLVGQLWTLIEKMSHQLVSKINPEGSALRVILPLPMEHCSSQAYNNLSTPS